MVEFLLFPQSSQLYHPSLNRLLDEIAFFFFFTETVNEQKKLEYIRKLENIFPPILFPKPLDGFWIFFSLFILLQVYEYITFYKEKHVTLVSLPGMQKRTIITSSLSKTFVLMFCWRSLSLYSLSLPWHQLIILPCSNHTASLLVCCLSGWRVGWAIASACIASTIRNIHTRITDCAPAPFQEAVVTALRIPPEYFELLRSVGSMNQFFKFLFHQIWLLIHLNNM